MSGLTFTCSWTKHSTAAAGRCEGHNHRTDPTASQLPQAAWLATKSHYVGGGFNQARLAEARGLAKRKDAVVAIEFVIQLGDQADWREQPTATWPHGKPRNPPPADALAMMRTAYKALASEFGDENVLDVALHMDESTPHVHVVVVPIKDGKLQAKAWLDGAKKCAELRERIHAHFAPKFGCTYKPGAPGGKPHDPGKAAGQQPPKNPLEAVLDAAAGRKRIQELEAELAAAKQAQAMAFAAAKKAIKAGEEAKTLAGNERKAARSAFERGKWSRDAEVAELREQLAQAREQLAKTQEQLASIVQRNSNKPAAVCKP